MSLSSSEFVEKLNLKNKASSSMKFKKALNNLGLNTNSNVRGSEGTSKEETLYLHPTKGTHWVLYVNIYYFHSYGLPTTKSLSDFIIKGIGISFYSEYKLQIRDTCCFSYCLKLFHLFEKIRNIFQICCFTFIIKRIMTLREKRFDNSVKFVSDNASISSYESLQADTEKQIKLKYVRKASFLLWCEKTNVF